MGKRRENMGPISYQHSTQSASTTFKLEKIFLVTLEEWRKPIISAEMDIWIRFCMECVVKANAVAVSFHEWRFRRRKLQAWVTWRSQKRNQALAPMVVRVRPKVEVEVKDEDDSKMGFADEEDYIKAGGSELLFVGMQGRKLMSMQGKIADKVGLNSSNKFNILPSSSNWLSKSQIWLL